MIETLNDRLDRMELSIKSLSDKIDQIKPADINKKQVAKLIDEISTQVKSIKLGISEKDVSSMISDSIIGTKPKERDISEEIDTAIKRRVTREFVNVLYRGN